MGKSQLAYISYDTVPAPKGASTHITAFSLALASTFGNLELVTVSPNTEQVNDYQLYPGVMQTILPAVGETFIHRVIYFRNLLKIWLQKCYFSTIQIRSIYEGYPIALHKPKFCQKLIFEVNALPSIELKYRYPNITEDKELLHKIKTQEKICLDAADLIITPSKVTGEYLKSRGVDGEKIQVIPNGVDTDIFHYYCSDISHPCSHPWQMIYFGTLSPWQGVNLAIEALALLNRDIPTHLTIIGQGKPYQIELCQQLVTKLQVQEKIQILEPISQNKLVEYIHRADVVLAPLTASDRNLIQGCCPLKILEAMATGTPVVASDLPVVRELGTNGVDFLLVKPGSAKAIKDAVLQLYHDRELGKYLAAHARQRIEQFYTWECAGNSLVKGYKSIQN